MTACLDEHSLVRRMAEPEGMLRKHWAVSPASFPLQLSQHNMHELPAEEITSQHKRVVSCAALICGTHFNENSKHIFQATKASGDTPISNAGTATAAAGRQDGPHRRARPLKLRCRQLSPVRDVDFSL
jgi:hypothetical protein